MPQNLLLTKVNLVKAGLIIFALLFSAHIPAQIFDQEELIAPNSSADRHAGALFGNSVAIDGNTAVVGAYNQKKRSGSSGEYGAAFIFERQSDNSWNQVAELTAPTQYTERFGWSVAIKNDVIVVGAPKRSFGSTSHAGRAFVYRKSSGIWNTSPTSELVPNDQATGAQFGISVDVANPGGGNAYTIVIGAWGDNKDSDSNIDNVGSVYLYQFNNVTDGNYSNSVITSLNATAKLTDLNGDGGSTYSGADVKSGDTLGNSVTISANGSTVVAAAFGDDDLGGTDSGAVFVWQRPGNGWENWNHLGLNAMDATRKLGFTNIESFDRFGTSVDINDNATIIVAGSRGYDDGSLSGVGAVFMFIQSSADWSGTGILNQDILLKDDNQERDSNDRIGASVSISPDNSVVVSGLNDFNNGHSGRPEKMLLWNEPSAGWSSAGSTIIKSQTITASDQPSECAGINNVNNLPCDFFAASISNAVWTDGIRIIVGAAGHNDIANLLAPQPGDQSGIAYVYTISSGLTFSISDNEPLPSPVTPGNNYQYTLIVSNFNNNYSARNINITSTLPPEVSYVSDDAGCSHSNGTVTCNLNDITPYNSQNVVINVSTTINQQYSVTNTSTVNATINGTPEQRQVSEDTLINTNPVILPNQIFYFDEGATVGVKGTDENGIDQIIAIIDDENSSSTLSIIDNDSNPWAFRKSSQNFIKVRSNITLDAEDRAAYTLTLRLDDGITSAEQTVSVIVRDINEFSPIISPSNVDINLLQATSIGSVFHTVTATDNDVTATITFSLANNFNNTFEIDSINGQITLLKTLNAEQTASYNLVAIASDGENTDNANINITVIPPNIPPLADSQNVATNEDQSIAITLTGSDGDTSPQETLVFILVNTPTHGSLTGNGASRSYQPDANYFGSDSFTFKTNDGEDDSNVATVTITVNSVNDAPVATAQGNVATEEDLSVSITLAGTDIEDNNVSLGFVIDSPPSHGTLSAISGSGLNYTPIQEYNGTDSFTFRARDGDNLSSDQPALVSISISAKNDAPKANNAVVQTPEEVPVDFVLTGSDIDTGDTLTFIKTSDPIHGTLSGSLPNLSYSPDTNYTGLDTFTFKVRDNGTGNLESAEATITLSVGPVNDLPVADNQSISTAEDEPIDITLTGMDPENEPVAFDIIEAPSNGTLSSLAGSNLIYSPSPDFFGTDEFTFKINDGLFDSVPATVSISVSENNHIPELLSNGINGLIISEGQTAELVFAVEDEDTTDTFNFIVGGESLGIAAFNSSTLLYQAQTTGTETLIISVTDSRGFSSPDLMLSVIINPAGQDDINNDGLSDQQAIAAGLNPALSDNDGDGTPDTQELGDPSSPTDSDNDGIIDALETNAGEDDDSKLGFFITEAIANELGLPDLINQTILISAGGDSQITAFNSPPLLEENTLPDDAGFSFLSLGIFDFSVTTNSGTAVVTFQFPQNINIPENTIIRKLDINDSWQTFQSAVFDIDSNKVTLTLTDNDNFDRDPTVGVIRDPFGIAKSNQTVAEGGGGGALSENYLFILFTLFMVVKINQKRLNKRRHYLTY